jgi:pyridoxamine 5'-phosphate oxidase
MDFKDCIKFANETPVCYLATVEGDQPRVRALSFWFADETGFYLLIGSMKDMYGQIQANPKAEICFWTPAEAPADPMSSTMMRVAGEVEIVDDPKLQNKAFEDKPLMKEVGMTFEHPGLAIIRIAKGKAYFYTTEKALQPKKFINFGD